MGFRGTEESWALKAGHRLDDSGSALQRMTAETAVTRAAPL